MPEPSRAEGVAMRYKSLPLIVRQAPRPDPPRTVEPPPHSENGWVSTGVMLLAVVVVVLPLMTARATVRTLALDPAQGPAGFTMTVVGTGFVPGQRGTVSFDNSTDGMTAFRADRTGSFSARLTVPADASVGDHTVKAIAGDRRGGTRLGTTTVGAVLAVTFFTVLTQDSTPSPTTAASPTTGTVSASPQASATPPQSSSTASAAATSTAAATPTQSPVPTPLPALAAIDGMTTLIGDVWLASGYHYGLHDSDGASMDTLKVIDDPGGGYLGVYHTNLGSAFATRVATSADMLTWTYRATLDTHTSQPTIAPTSDGGFVVALEADNNGLASPSATWVRLRHYASRGDLLRGASDARFDAPHTLVKPVSQGGAEGTPNIYSASLSPDLEHSVIVLGFHYFKDAYVDRQARATLTNFSSWTTRTEPGIDAALEALGCTGNIGDRDSLIYDGVRLNIHEGQLARNDWSAWRVFLYEPSTGLAKRLAVRTHGGSVSLANPTYSWVTSPSGKRAVAVTLFIPVSGAARGEAGELLYYREVE